MINPKKSRQSDAGDQFMFEVYGEPESSSSVEDEMTSEETSDETDEIIERKRGIVVWESTGDEPEQRGVIVSDDVSHSEHYYFSKYGVDDYVSLIAGDEVSFVTSPKNRGEQSASSIILMRRSRAVGFVSAVNICDKIHFEILGFAFALAMSMDCPVVSSITFKCGDEVACVIERGEDDFYISDIELLLPGTILPERKLEKSVDGAVTDPVDFHCGYILIRAPKVQGIIYFLYSQRNRSDTFHGGDGVEFKIVSFFRGDRTAYDVVSK